jgi:hypothetical protein
MVAICHSKLDLIEVNGPRLGWRHPNHATLSQDVGLPLPLFAGPKRWRLPGKTAAWTI